MKIGLFLALFSDRPLEEALDAAVAAGCETVEIMSGAWSPHCRPAELLEDPAARKHLASLVAERGLAISALSCHANPLHPGRGFAAGADEAYRDTVRLAAELGVATVVTFSGCPGESEHSLRPSWVTCSWPDDFPETLAWQWDERVLPYWADAAAFAERNGIRVAIEPHPGFVVYNSASMVRLRESAGDNVGVNFDPSHLFWQGMDPLACVRRSVMRSSMCMRRTRPSSQICSRSTACSSLSRATDPPSGAGSSARSALGIPSSSGGPRRRPGRGGLRRRLSIEHEDPLLSHADGLALSVTTLRAALGYGGLADAG